MSEKSLEKSPCDAIATKLILPDGTAIFAKLTVLSFPEANSRS